MESTLTGVARTLSAASVAAPALPTMLTEAGTGRVTRTAVASSSARVTSPCAAIRPIPMSGGASYGVSQKWRNDLQQNDPQSIQGFHKFTTRQGPPTCSPPA